MSEHEQNPPKRKITLQTGKTKAGQPVVVRSATASPVSPSPSPAPLPVKPAASAPVTAPTPAQKAPTPSVKFDDDKADASSGKLASHAIDFLSAAAAVTFTVLLARDLLPHL